MRLECIIGCMFWLMLGQMAYMLALAFRLYELNSKVEGKPYNYSKKSFLLGLAAILLGPLTLVFVIYSRKD